MKASESYLTTDEGVRLFVETRGDGSSKVLVPNGTYLAEDFEPLAEGRTLVFYDARNRGRSDRALDASTLEGGIHRDVSDLDAVRRHFGIARADLIGHSYMGLMVVLYAMRNPALVGRIVQVGPMEPYPAKTYPAHLTGADDALREVFARIGQLQAARASLDPVEFCRRVWAELRLIYVVDPADADRIKWGRCELPNELSFMKYWNEVMLPSIRGLGFIEDDLAKVEAPVLTVHGRRDRSAPYGGGREWALLLPNARLVTIENAGHAPWIEAPDQVFGAISAFLEGGWPDTARRVESLEP